MLGKVIISASVMSMLETKLPQLNVVKGESAALGEVTLYMVS